MKKKFDVCIFSLFCLLWINPLLFSLISTILIKELIIFYSLNSIYLFILLSIFFQFIQFFHFIKISQLALNLF